MQRATVPVVVPEPFGRWNCSTTNSRSQNPSTVQAMQEKTSRMKSGEYAEIFTLRQKHAASSAQRFLLTCVQREPVL
eukprot:COSAG06_NODE_29184_length_561_cov_0.694805_1_plen_76_part_10